MISLDTDLAPSPPETHAEQLQPERDPKLQSARVEVLVIEDDPSSRELLVDLLSAWGYRVTAVGSAEEAELVARRRPIQAAIVDLFLPGRSGISAISRLRERFPEAILVGTSALGDSAMARRCKGTGADRFLAKPFSPENLAAALVSEHHSWH